MLLIREPVMTPDANAAEKPGEHDLAAKHLGGIIFLKVR